MQDLFTIIKNKLKPIKKNKTTNNWLDGSFDIDERLKIIKKEKLNKDLNSNLTKIKEIMGDSYDLKIRKFFIGKKEIRAAIIYINGLEDSRAIERIVADLTGEIIKTKVSSSSPIEAFETIFSRINSNEELMRENSLENVFDKVLLGDTIILVNGVDEGIICDTKEWEVRAVEEPESEKTIRGPRDGFVESLKVNTSLVRRRIKNPNLWIESMDIGKMTKTRVAFAYIKGLCQEDLVNEVRARLKKIDIDDILESGYIEEYLMDTHCTLFPLLHRTERTDIVSANILEGKVVIFTEGTPFVLIAPARFHEFLQAPDDYYEIFPIGSFLRLGRHLGFLISIFLPGVYVAVINFHPELVPSTLLLRITASRQGVPFPAVAEIYLMEFVFEMLREAGLRLPGMIGPAISIVGALILGEAAIQAGIVSPIVVIIVAMTAIASFISPAFSLSVAGRLLRFIVIFAGAIMGLFGIQFIFLFIVIHLSSLRSFGYPYFAPVAPIIKGDWSDLFFRMPWWSQSRRPELTAGRYPYFQSQDKKGKQFPPEGLEKREKPYKENSSKDQEGN